MSERGYAGSGDGDDEAIDVDDFDRRRQQPGRGNIIDEPPLTQFDEDSVPPEPIRDDTNRQYEDRPVHSIPDDYYEKAGQQQGEVLRDTDDGHKLQQQQQHKKHHHHKRPEDDE